MDIEQAHDCLYTAVRALTLINAPLSERLQHGYVRSMMLRVKQSNIPPQYHNDLNDIQDFLQHLPINLPENTAGMYIERILNLYSDLLIYIGRNHLLPQLFQYDSETNSL